MRNSYLIVDRPLQDEEELKEVKDWYEYKKIIDDIVSLAKESEGVNIAIVGDWGTGKTTFLRILQHELRREGHIVVFYDAWRYQNNEDVLLSMLIVIKEQVEKQLSDENKEVLKKKIDNLIKYIKTDVIKEKIEEFVKIFGKIKIDAGTAGVIDILSKAVSSLIFRISAPGVTEVFPRIYESSITRETRVQNEIYKRLNSIFKDLGKNGKYFILLVDDVDRLLPSRAIHLLEDLRFYFYLDNVIVIMGVNERILVKYLEKLKIYDCSDAQRFLEKIFNIRFYLRPARVNGYHIKGLLNLMRDNGCDIKKDVLLRFIRFHDGEEEMVVPHRLWIKLFNSLVLNLTHRQKIVERILSIDTKGIKWCDMNHNVNDDEDIKRKVIEAISTLDHISYYRDFLPRRVPIFKK